MNTQNPTNAVVIGNPISHSKSPIIHSYWLDLHAISGTYKSLQLENVQLPAFCNAIREKKYVGANVTLPFKTKILEQCDDISPSAKALGAVNTLFIRNGRLQGDNTDAYGFLANLDAGQPQWDKTNNMAIVLGAGGAARAVIYALAQRKYKNIIILNRTLQNAEKLVQHFEPIAKNSTLTADIITNFPLYAPKTNFVVNASSVGLNATKFEGLALNMLKTPTLVHDIVYSPLQTPLLLEAQNLGLKTLDGLGMLLHQAVPGFEKWFGVRPRVTPALRQKIVNTLQ